MIKLLAVMHYVKQEVEALLEKRGPNDYLRQDEKEHLAKLIDTLVDELTRYCKGEDRC